MKRIKLMAAAAIMAAVATAGYMGYTAYEYATMTPQERLFKANLEVLTSGEYDFPDGKPYVHTCGVETGGTNIFGQANTCKVQVTDCQGGGSGCNEYKCPSHSTN